MAKGSLIGVKSGKLGDIVMYATNGKQGFRAYNGKPRNPRTPAQMLQRAKFNLAGRISHIITKQMITGLNYGSTIGNRSAFTRSLIKATEVKRNADNTGFAAAINAENIVFSQGQAVVPEGIRLQVGIAAGFGSYHGGLDDNLIELRILADNSVSQQTLDDFNAQFIIIAVNNITNHYDYALNIIANKPSLVNRINVASTVVSIPELATHSLFIYQIPINADYSEIASAASTYLGTQLTPENQTQITAEILFNSYTLESRINGNSTLFWEDKGSDLTEIMANRLVKATTVTDYAGVIVVEPDTFRVSYWAIGFYGNGLPFCDNPYISLQQSRHSVRVAWTKSVTQADDDQLNVVVTNVPQGAALSFINVAQARAQQAEIPLPESWSVDHGNYSVYIYFSNAQNNKVSKSYQEGI